MEKNTGKHVRIVRSQGKHYITPQAAPSQHTTFLRERVTTQAIIESGRSTEREQSVITFRQDEWSHEKMKSINIVTQTSNITR